MISKCQWIHLHLWFKKGFSVLDNEKNIRTLVLSLQPYIRRKFYLYEPEPDCFLALEVKEGMLETIQKWFETIKFTLLTIYEKVSLELNTKDEQNNCFFIDVMDKVTDYNLNYFGLTGRHKKGQRTPSDYLTHIIHCMCNQMYGSKKSEKKLYELLIKKYSND